MFGIKHFQMHFLLSCTFIMLWYHRIYWRQLKQGLIEKNMKGECSSPWIPHHINSMQRHVNNFLIKRMHWNKSTLRWHLGDNKVYSTESDANPYTILFLLECADSSISSNYSPRQINYILIDLSAISMISQMCLLCNQFYGEWCNIIRQWLVPKLHFSDSVIYIS